MGLLADSIRTTIYRGNVVMAWHDRCDLGTNPADRVISEQLQRRFFQRGARAATLTFEKRAAAI
jgi:hypothetical protein